MTPPFLPRRILVTGGAGFIGSDFVRFLLRADGRADDSPSGILEVVNLDLLTYAGNLENLASVEGDPRYRFIRGDICDPEAVREAMAGMDAVVHCAAESHVDRSIQGDVPFIRTNVEGTRVLLAAAREAGVARVLQVSTDEVYGELPWRDPASEPTADALLRSRWNLDGAPGFFREDTPLAPRSPYSASKAAGDLLALAYHATHGLPVVVTRCTNNYGPFQFPEKLIPLMITNGLRGEPLPVYGDGLNVRDWIHVRDHSRGLWAALVRGTPGAVYNFGGLSERTNLQVVRRILPTLGLGEEAIRHVADRPGHDRRYAVDPTRAQRELGWTPTRSFEEGLEDTVAWYREHSGWWERVRSGAYREYYEALYGPGGRHGEGGAHRIGAALAGQSAQGAGGAPAAEGAEGTGAV